MKKIFLSIVLGIFLIGIASAVTYNISAGDTQTFDIGEVYDYYSVVGNSSEVFLNVSQNGTLVTITTDKYSLSDSFEIIFFNKEKEVIYEHSSSGGRSSCGGGSGFRRVDESEPCETCNNNLYPIENNTPIKCTDGKKPNVPLVPLALVLGIIGVLACTLILYIYVIVKYVIVKRGKDGVQTDN